MHNKQAKITEMEWDGRKLRGFLGREESEGGDGDVSISGMGQGVGSSQ